MFFVELSKPIELLVEVLPILICRIEFILVIPNEKNGKSREQHRDQSAPGRHAFQDIGVDDIQLFRFKVQTEPNSEKAGV